MFEGKNAVQQSAHIRSVKHPGGNQGFSSNNLGSGTTLRSGNDTGAPLHNHAKPQTDKKHAPVVRGNPFNPFVGNTAGVLGPNVKGQDAGLYQDSPVPGAAQKPNTSIISKAGEVAAETGQSLHPDGVLGRG